MIKYLIVVAVLLMASAANAQPAADLCIPSFPSFLTIGDLERLTVFHDRRIIINPEEVFNLMVRGRIVIVSETMLTDEFKKMLGDRVGECLAKEEQK